MDDSTYTYTTQPPPNGRGCGGDRTEGHPYACSGLAADGMPLEYFLIDPVIPWPGGWQRGVKILPHGDTHHLVVFVGKKFYPSPWDFLEEARTYGVSRKIPKNLPFDKLTPGKSKMIFVHARAIPRFEFVLRPTDHGQQTPMYGCKWTPPEGGQLRLAWEGTPRGYHPGQEEPVSSCTSALRDLTCLMRETNPLVSQATGEVMEGWREVEFASTTYSVREPIAPTDPTECEWGLGMWLATPLTHFEFPKSADESVQGEINKAGFEAPVKDW